MMPCCQRPSMRSRTSPHCPPPRPCIWTPAMTTGPAERHSTNEACSPRSPTAAPPRPSRSAAAGSSSAPTPGSTASAGCAAAPSDTATASMPTCAWPPPSSPSVPFCGPLGASTAGTPGHDHHASADLMADALTERIARKLTLNGIGAAARTAVAEETRGQMPEPPRPRCAQVNLPTILLCNTLRQVGTATGVAVFGALYASRVTAATLHALAALPAPAGTAHRLATAPPSRAGNRGAPPAPPTARAAVTHAARAGTASGLNDVLLAAAAFAALAAIAGFAFGPDPASRPQPSPAPSTSSAQPVAPGPGPGDRAAPGLPPPRAEVAPSAHPSLTPVGEVSASPRNAPVDDGGGS